MKNKPSSYVITVGLAVFSMFFGAGNLIYPLNVGIHAGKYTAIALLGFILTAVCLPLTGLVAMILFDGDYGSFFSRMGTTVGKVTVFVSMLVIGPLIAIPRVVTLSHTMIAPFMPFEFFRVITLKSSFIFALIFLGATFLTTFRKNKIIDLLAVVVSPLLLLSLATIIIKGMLSAQTPVATIVTPLQAFTVNFMRGYETLDLLGGIFFSSIVIHILKNTTGGINRNQLALIGLKAGTLGVSLLGITYIGMSFLSMYHGHGMALNSGLFRELAFSILGPNGALIIATAVLLACLSTAIALGAVVGEYMQQTIFHNTICYVSALALVLLLSLPISTFGLDYVVSLTGGPLVFIGYPVLITLTICNMAYKLFDFKPVKFPVGIVFVASLIGYFYW